MHTVERWRNFKFQIKISVQQEEVVRKISVALKRNCSIDYAYFSVNFWFINLQRSWLKKDFSWFFAEVYTA